MPQLTYLYGISLSLAGSQGKNFLDIAAAKLLAEMPKFSPQALATGKPTVETAAESNITIPRNSKGVPIGK